MRDICVRLEEGCTREAKISFGQSCKFERDVRALLSKLVYMQAQFVDPVIAADGHTYERGAFNLHLQRHNTSPVSQKQLATKHVVPNRIIKALVNEM